MSSCKHASALSDFVSRVFDNRSDWGLRDIAVSDQGWSVEITHNEHDLGWVVMGDEDSILFRIKEGAKPLTFSIYPNPTTDGNSWAIHAVKSLTSHQMWGWLKYVEEEEDFTEVV